MDEPTEMGALEAYRAMFRFLEGYWERTKSDDVAGLLGSMNINLADGAPMDSAMWSDWLDAVREVTSSEEPE